MSLNIIGRFACPVCGAENQSFLAASALSRTVKGSCRNCGARLRSNVPYGEYLLWLLYAHVVLMFGAFPLVLALAARQWGIAAIMFLILSVIIWPPAMILHAKNVIASDPPVDKG